MRLVGTMLVLTACGLSLMNVTKNKQQRNSFFGKNIAIALYLSEEIIYLKSYMARTQRYGIKFPINVSSEDMTLFDLSHTRAEQVKSEIMHLIFTPKGQRLRNPDFGTRLVQFIFNPDDSQTWGDIVTEIKDTVKLWIPDCTVKEVEVAEYEEGLTLYARIKYTLVEDDGSTGNYEIISKL